MSEYIKLPYNDFREMRNVPSRLRAWIDILIHAQEENRTIVYNNQRFQLKRGQQLTNVRALQKRWEANDYSPSKLGVMWSLYLLEETGRITVEKIHPRMILITVCNCELYLS
jgi:hypothetical protein